jgi:hypothetical protein
MAKGKKTGGRKKGSTQKVTVAVKDALTASVLVDGWRKGLAAWGKDNPELFYPIWRSCSRKRLRPSTPGRRRPDLR